MKLWVLGICFLGATLAQGLTIDLEKVPKDPKKKIDVKVPVILDTRPALDFGFSRVEQSAPIRWQDYSQTEEPAKSLLDSNFDILARRLRTLGVTPKRPVVVLGLGLNGGGEEGRIAWMLSFLGVENVEIHPYETFKAKHTDKPWEGNLGAPIWLVKVKPNFRVSKGELAGLIASRKNDFVLIDVRTSEEFTGKTQAAKRAGHIPGSKNILWTEFLDGSGNILSKEKLREKLAARQITPDKELIFIATQGVRSGLATFVAMKAGFNARNYDGGIWEWSYDDKLPLEKGP